MSSIGPRTFSLPPEIVDQILGSSQLRTKDLANCCRVDRCWLGPARRSLYASLSVRLHQGQDSTGEADEDRGLAAEIPYRLGSSSAQLLGTLLCIRSLGQLVRKIELSEWGSLPVTSECSTVWMNPPEVLATFAQLCPRTTGLALKPFSEFPPLRFEATIRSKYTCLEEIRLSTVTTGIWRKLRQSTRLRKISTYTIELEPLLVGPPISACPITIFECLECTRATFDVIRSATWHSLRELKVPVNVVPVFRVSQLPHLHRLALRKDPEFREYDAWSFLRELEASNSLAILEIDHSAYESLEPGKGSLGKHLPLTCHRANLCISPSFDAILSLVALSRLGHRIRELGLPFSVRNDKSDNGQNFLVAARAMLESVEVELIWFDDRGFCKS